MTDLTSRKWIIAKGMMFALIVLMSAVGIIVYEDRWQRLGLLLVCVSLLLFSLLRARTVCRRGGAIRRDLGFTATSVVAAAALIVGDGS